MRKITWSETGKDVFRALKNRNYALFFCGQGISLLGTWMQRIAMSWLVYRLTNSVLLLGVISFTNQIPTFFLAPIAGVYADRLNRRLALIITQILAMLQAFILALLVLSDTVQVWQVALLGATLGVINAFDTPIRQSFVVEMVEHKEDLGNAIALNSSLVNSARLIGPSVAGFLISWVGEGVCFLLNALSYIAVIAALTAMKVAAKETSVAHQKVWRELCEGCYYAFYDRRIRDVLLLLALVSLVGMPYVVLMPAFAGEVLQGGAHTLGLLMGASGLGAIGGTIFLAARKEDAMPLERLIFGAAVLFGIGLILFSFTKLFVFSLLALVITGFGMTVEMAASNTLLQFIVEESKRGRIMSFYTMSFMGMAPFGALLGGSLADHIGVTNTLLSGGIFCIGGALFFACSMRVSLRG
ncbi:MFS transporter [Azotosporobacter soli]|uniref:MFS transporter n=1 Tax=Azotosporobacter soli TaxID=3055040 RepID=UPI0031FF0E23